MAASDAPAPARFSLALGAKKAALPTAKKRPHSTLHDSDDEDATAPQAQEVSHFDQAAGGAIDAGKPKADTGPLVIKKQENRDWRAESQRKRQRNLPHEVAAQAAAQAIGNGAQNGAGNFGEEEPVFGLNIVKKTEGRDADVTDANAIGAATPTVPDEPAPAPAEPKTEDQRALEALLGQKEKSTLVLPAVETEEEAFRRDYDNAPDMATLEDYEAVPVEEFGAALLRGMGWKEGEAIGRRKGQKAVQPRILERRPALLGIGAKEDAAIGLELGAWGKGAKGKRKTEQSYNPVMLKNKKTGEQLTEEELRQKLEDQKAAERDRELAKMKEFPARESERRSEKSSRRHKYDDDDREPDTREKDRRRRDRDRDRDYDSKHRSSRLDRDGGSQDDDKYRRRKQDSRSDYDGKNGDRKQGDRSRDSYSKSSSRREHRDRSKERYRDSDRRRRRDD